MGILNRQKVTPRPTGGYYNAPRSAPPQETPAESERSDFGESGFTGQSNLRRGFRGSRPGNRSIQARGSYKSPSPRENQLTAQITRSDFGSSAAEAQNQNLPERTSALQKYHGPPDWRVSIL